MNMTKIIIAVVNTMFTIEIEKAIQHKEIKTIRISNTGDVQILPDEWILNRLEKTTI